MFFGKSESECTSENDLGQFSIFCAVEENEARMNGAFVVVYRSISKHDIAPVDATREHCARISALYHGFRPVEKSCIPRSLKIQTAPPHETLCNLGLRSAL